MPTQSIDFSAVTVANFNGVSLSEILLNGSNVWTVPASGPSGNWIFTVSDPSSGSDTWFGYSCAINETANVFAIGSYMVPKIDFFNATTGALLFTKTREFAGGPQYRYPVSVDISETHILIGWVSGGASDQGAAYLYDLSGNLVTTYLSPIPNWNFGNAVALGSNFVVIGDGRTEYATGPLGWMNGYSNGRAYIYNLTGTLLHTLTPSTNAGYLRFGSTISISGNYILVGNSASDAYGNGQDNAEVSLFNTSGVRLWTITNPNPAELGTFGHTLAISGDRIAIATYAGSSGISSRLYIYDLSGTLLTQIHRSDVHGGSWPWYGGNQYHMDMDGDTIVLSNNFSTSNTGHAYLYDTSGQEIAYMQAPTPSPGTGYGKSVSISGNKLLVTQGDGSSPYTEAKAFVYT